MEDGRQMRPHSPIHCYLNPNSVLFLHPKGISVRNIRLLWTLFLLSYSQKIEFFTISALCFTDRQTDGCTDG